MTTRDAPGNQRLHRPVVDRLKLRTAWGSPGVETGPGWDNILDLTDAAIERLVPDYQVVHVQERFGTMRYRTTYDEDPQVRTITEVAEDISSGTCELCGADGRLRVAGWVKTFCDQCFEDHS